MEHTAVMILTVFDTVILPDVDYRLNIGSFGEAERERLKADDGHCVLLPIRSLKGKTEVTQTDCYEYGVLADVLEIDDDRQGTFLHIQSRGKVRVLEVENADGILSGTYEPVNEVIDVTARGEKEFLEMLKKTTTEIAGNFRGADYAIEYIKTIESVNEYAAAFCQFYDMTPEQKYELLATDSFRERMSLIHDAMMRFKSTIELQVELANKDDADGNAYKKAAINKQIGLLQKELAEMDPNAEEDEEGFAYKIDHCGMPDDIKKEAKRVLRRFEQEPANGAEYNSLYDYLDFITSLAWRPGEPKKIDLSIDIVGSFLIQRVIDVSGTFRMPVGG